MIRVGICLIIITLLWCVFQSLRQMQLPEWRSMRTAIFKIEENQKQVIVEKLGKPAQGYEDFAACLPPNECRYAIYDFEFLTEGNVPKSRIFFIAW
ncbi:hypothetical protein AHAS_Ahas13G0300900 [Arachis hypogaea]